MLRKQDPHRGPGGLCPRGSRNGEAHVDHVEELGHHAVVTGAVRKSLRTPEETITFPGATQGMVELGDLTVGRFVAQPGWRWSEHVRPEVGGEWCRARHVGVVISGRIHVISQDGTEMELAPDDAYDVPPGHDAYVVGDKPLVQIEWQGLRTFVGSRGGIRGRRLATLLFTDLVDSTSTAAELGDTAWRELLSRHYQSARNELDRFGGREVKTTGDGILAVFDGPRCGPPLRSRDPFSRRITSPSDPRRGTRRRGRSCRDRGGRPRRPRGSEDHGRRGPAGDPGVRNH